MPVKSTVDISQNFVAFSEYMNFTEPWRFGKMIFVATPESLGLNTFYKEHSFLMHFCFPRHSLTLQCYVHFIIEEIHRENTGA